MALSNIDPKSINNANQDRVLPQNLSNTQEVKLPETKEKVPRVMVPVQDGQTLVAIPIMSKIQETHQQQARELLTWKDGIGTLDGCDLRFRTNQLGCLELLDSDDEELPQKKNLIQPTITRKISPGSSLLRDGPNLAKRARSSSTNNTLNHNNLNHHNLTNNHHHNHHHNNSSITANTTTTSNNNANAIRNQLMKFEQMRRLALVDELIKFNEVKSNLTDWTIEDVKRFVDSIPGCSGCGDLFAAQKICGKSLPYLDQKDLLDVINIKLGPAVKIYHAISRLK